MTDAMRELIQYHHLNKTYSFHQRLQLVAGGKEIRLNVVLVLVFVLLPLANAGREDGVRVVPAQEILDKIGRGEPVEYDHVVVKGDLKRNPDDVRMGRSEKAAVVLSRIRITDSLIDGNLYFNNSIFGAIDFSGTIFNGSAYFGGASFNGPVYFISSSFDDLINFFDSSFNDSAYFSDSSFNGPAYFISSSFNETPYFIDSSFNDSAYFWDSLFNGRAAFKGSSFNSVADFKGSSFNSFADFGSSEFNGPDFSSSQFNKQVSFDDSQFKGSTSFKSTRFKEDASFEGADFNGTLYLDRAKYDKLYISWKNIKELGYDDAAYLALLENFKKLGYFEDYDACYYDYRQKHRDQDWSGRYHAMHSAEEWTRKRIDVLLEVFYGYGKKPLLPLLWSAGIIILFGIIWSMAGMNGRQGNGRGIFERFGQQNTTVKSERQGLLGGPRALADGMLFSATVFLSGTRLFVEPPAQPEMQELSANQVKWAMIFERVLGALFSILFFLAISGTVVR